MKKTVSIIVSVYNEQDILPEFWKNINSVLSNIRNYNTKLVFVNDGSKDNSQQIINSFVSENTSEIEVQTIEFSRNFGHEAAMIAGIDNANSDVIICLDSDLQHPPEQIPIILAQYEKGSEIILMKRTKRHDNGFFKNFSSAFFYKLILWLSGQHFEQNASDFFMVSNKVANVLKDNFRERNRFLRGFIQIIGFNLDTIEYESPARFSGESNYSFSSLIKLSFTAIFAFSNKPLQLSLVSSILFFIFSFCMIIYSLFVYFFGDTPPTGYTTLIIFQSVGFTILCFIISMLSIYFGKSLEEIRDRPIYLIKTIKSSLHTIDK